MAKFEMRYSGIGTCVNNEWEDCDANTFDKAQEEAYQLARQDYEGYEGYHGIRGICDIMEEEGLDEKEAEEEYNQEIESWLDYQVRGKKPPTNQ